MSFARKLAAGAAFGALSFAFAAPAVHAQQTTAAVRGARSAINPIRSRPNAMLKLRFPESLWADSFEIWCNGTVPIRR